MARKYELITELYQRTMAGLTTPQVWQSFLTTACRNFRLPFDEQVLLYAQRPDATAVLPIEGKNGWNRRFGRWVNRGSTGIAVFDDEQPGRSRLKYYFDISDTHKGRFSKPVPIWTIRPEFEPTIIETLENSFGELADKTDLAAALISSAKNTVEDNMPDYLSELKSYKVNSFLEELDDLNIEVQYRMLLESSVAYMLLARCGIDPAEYFDDDDFRGIVDFSTPETLNALGVATGDIGKMCLSVISRTALVLEKQAEKQNRRFANRGQSRYPVSKAETTHSEGSFEDERNHIHDAGRLQTAQPPAAPGAGGTIWEIRIDAPEVSETEPARDLHEPADIGQAEPASHGDRADGSGPDGADHGADGDGAGRDGGVESPESDEMAGPDEQHSSGGGGDRSERGDLQLTVQEPAADEVIEEADSAELPAFLDDTLIMAIIANRDDDLKYKKQQIELYFSIHPDEAERAEYLKSAYQDRYTEILVDGVRVGYKPQEDGLLMWNGAYLSRTSESVFSWATVAEWTAQLIEQKKYFVKTQIIPPKDQDTQQLTLFDFADFNTPAQENDGQLAFTIPRPQLPQQIIDEALCIGSNEEHSRLIICAYFMKDHSLEDNARFLAAHYGENGAGFYVAGGWIAVVIILIVVLLGCAVSLFGGGSGSNSYTPVSAEVEAYTPLIRQYAAQHGIPEYVELIKAVMMQESGGRGTDPMQASESGYNTRYPNTPGAITDPEYSIDVGVRTLAESLRAAQVENPIDMDHIKLALQGYNFGNGYISWALSNYGGYSYANAVEFSTTQAERLGWSGYGDTQYVNHVLRYYPYGRAFTAGGNQAIVEVALTQIGNEGGEPYWSWYGFDSRVEWCACFVSWCADQCGYIEAGIIPKFSGVSDGVSWFSGNGQWQGRDYEPAAGDLIFFDWDGDGSPDHVGIVENCENGIVYTVEGNSGDACSQRQYGVGSSSIYGYGIPAY